MVLPTTRTESSVPVIVLLLPNTPLLFALIVPLLLPTLYVPVPLIVVGSPIAPDPCPVTIFPVPILIVSFAVACAPVPIAIPFSPLLVELLPTDIADVFVALAEAPRATELFPLAVVPVLLQSRPVPCELPIATELFPDETLECPSEVDFIPVAALTVPNDNAKSFVALDSRPIAKAALPFVYERFPMATLLLPFE